MDKIVVPRIPGGGAHSHEAASLYGADGGRKYLNQAERRRVLTATGLLDVDEALFILTLAWTGARVSEVLSLTPASFQIERGIVAFSTLKRRRHVMREVPIPDSLITALDQQFDLAAAQLDLSRAAGRLWAWHRVTAWQITKKVMRLAHVQGRPACPRGFRHGFGVGALQADVPLTLVQRWLGHASMKTTAIYTDVCGPEERAFAARFWREAGVGAHDRPLSIPGKEDAWT